MKKLNKFNLVIIITEIIALLFLCGCWGEKELNDISLIVAAGIDSLPEGNVRMSVLAITPRSQIQPSEKSNVWIGAAKGVSLEDAMKNLNATSTKNLVWYHNRLIIVGEGMARQGLEELTDVYIRSRDARFNTKVMVCEGDAFDLFQVPSDIRENLADELDGLTKNAKEWSKAYVPTMQQYLSNGCKKFGSSLVGRLGYYMSSDNTFSTNKEEIKKQYWLDRELGVLFCEGSSVIKGSKLEGFLNGVETRGCLWITDKLEKGSITAIHEGNKLAMEFGDTIVDIKPEFSDNRPIMNIKLTVKGKLTEITGGLDILKPGDIKTVEKLWEKEIINEMSMALNKLQKEYDADALGFGEIIKRKEPKLWKKIGEEWGSIYPTVEIKYDVTVILRRFGMSIATMTN